VTDNRAAMWRGRRKLILVFLLFFGPALLAWLLILAGWRPAGTVNNGDLIQPPVPVAELLLSSEQGEPMGEQPFLGLWSALLIVDGPCDDDCLYTLDQMVRVRTALHKDADRLQLMLVLPEGAPAPALPPDGPERARLPREAVADLVERPAEGSAPASSVHLVDPFGFRMMKYAPPLDAQGLLKDLRRLLRLSNEDIERFQRLDRDQQ
jgi:hypothetical protein